MTRFIRNIIDKGRIVGVIGSENYTRIDSVYFIAPKTRAERRKEQRKIKS